VLESLIRGKAIYVLAKKAKTSVTDEEVDEGLAEAKKRLPEGEFEHLMEDRGITAQELDAKMREQLTCQKFFDEKTKDVEVTDEDVEQVYQKLKEAGRMQKPETADVAHILILAPREGTDEAIAEAKERIDAARDRVVNGKEDFGEVAKDVSEDRSSAPLGGLYENVPPNMMVPEFDKLMFELPIGEVSEPFQTRYGWHIMKVSERDPARTLEFDEVKDGIRRNLEAQAKQRAFGEFLETAIGDVKIEILLPRKDAAAPSPDSSAGIPAEGSKAGEEPELPDEPS
jgi:peptidyl-prolyl cis-trans isomerase C